MAGRLGAVGAVLALLLGFVAAPHTHVHQSATEAIDPPHPHETTVVHAHVTPHRHAPSVPAVETDEHEAQKIWSIDGFVFQAAAARQAPVPVLLPEVMTRVHRASRWLRVSLGRPNAHGPPYEIGSDLRAPPAVPPSLV